MPLSIHDTKKIDREAPVKHADVTAPMLKAGVSVVLESIPIDMLQIQGVDPAKLAADIFVAMAPNLWRPIETAPKTTQNVMLALVDEKSISQGIGCWIPPDDDSHGGWSTESWWGKAPTHWMPMLAPPSDSDGSEVRQA